MGFFGYSDKSVSCVCIMWICPKLTIAFDVFFFWWELRVESWELVWELVFSKSLISLNSSKVLMSSSSAAAES